MKQAGKVKSPERCDRGGDNRGEDDNDEWLSMMFQWFK